jgi:FkbM family methyltransferase
VGLFGLLCALKGAVTHTTSRVAVNNKNCRHPFRLRVPSPDLQAYRQIFIQQEYAFSAEIAPVVIIDAGAHIGLASIYFANRFPEATIVAIEPEQENFRLLVENTRPYPAIHPVNAALWHTNEEIDLVDPGRGNWGFTTEARRPGRQPQGKILQPVKAVTLDRLLEEFSLPAVNILKMDVEGAEHEIFSDSAAWIERVDAIIIELHDRIKKGCGSSLYRGARGFEHRWTRGENMYLSRTASLPGGCI